MEGSSGELQEVSPTADGILVDTVQDRAGVCIDREASCLAPGDKKESDWFLRVLNEPASCSSDLPLMHCGVCNRIVLVDRFHLHACQTTCCPKTNVVAPASLTRSRNLTNSRRIRQEEKEAKREGRGGIRGGSVTASTGAAGHGKNGGKRGRKCAKRGRGELVDLDIGDQNDVDDIKGAFWQTVGSGSWPGKKVKMRKLSDVVRNGPTLILSSPACLGGGDEEWDLSGIVRNDRSSDFCGQDLDWWGGGVEWPRDDEPRVEHHLEDSLQKGWDHLNKNGLLKFPDRVRRRRSPFPIRRSRYPPPVLPTEDDTDILINTTPLWYSVPFESLTDTMGSVTVLGFG